MANRGSAAAHVVCKNWQQFGSCRFGDGCHYKGGHAGAPGSIDRGRDVAAADALIMNACFSHAAAPASADGGGAALQDLASQTPADVCARVRTPSIAPKQFNWIL